MGKRENAIEGELVKEEGRDRGIELGSGEGRDRGIERENEIEG